MANDLPDGWVVESTPQQAAPQGDLPEGWTVESVPQDTPAATPQASQGATPGSVAMNYAAGTNEGVSAILGAPVDITTFGLNRGIDVANWLSRQFGGQNVADNIVNPVGGSQSIRDAQALYGGSPDQVAANNAPERIARGMGAGTTMALLPAAAAPALPARAAAMATQVTGAPTVGNAVLGTVAGGTGATAAEMVSDRWKPLVNLAGGLIGGGAVATLGTLGRAGLDAAKAYIEPFTQGGQQSIAGRTIAAAAQNPGEVRAALDAGAPELVPGSLPTTAQATGDVGLLSMERSLQTQRPDLFRQRAGEQNAARVSAIRGVETAGDPTAVTRLVQSQLRAIDEDTQRSLNSARNRADIANTDLGGDQKLEAYGSNIRDAAVTAENAARQQERALWAAVDPNGDLALNVAPVRDAVEQIRAGVTPSATPISGAESQIYNAAAAYNDVMPFKDLTDLRSNISQAMRQELRTNGRTQTYGRLSTLRNAVETTINTAVERQAQQEATAVAQGQMAPEQTISARLNQWVEDWLARRDAAASAGQGTAEGTGATESVGPGAFSAGPGAGGTGGGRPGEAPGAQGVPGAGLQPNFDAAAAERLAAASQATRERATTFGPNTPSGAVVRKGETSDAFRLSDAAVPARVFHPGPKGFEDVQQFRQAVGDASALPVLSDYAASSLRRAAGRPDGSLDPNKIVAWQKAHAEAMRAFPELSQRFATAETAERAVAEAAANRKQALDAFNQQAAARLLNLQAPEDVTRTIGGMFSNQNAATTFRELSATVSKSPEAQAGIRRAIVDYINGRFVGNTEAATSGVGTIKSDSFQTFVRQNRVALAQFFSADELQLIDNLVADLQRSNRSLNAVRIPGQSNTAQDQAAGRRYGVQESMLQRMATSGAGAGIGAVAGGPVGAAVGSGGMMVASAMRDAGLRNVQELITQAMLDPALARTLLLKAGNAEQAESYLGALARRLRTITMVGGSAAENNRRVKH